MGTITNKLNKIKNTKDKIKTITNLSTINTITSETIFKDYPKQILKEYVKIINNGTDELYTNFPKIEDEGTKLELDTEKGPLRMILEGNTSQKTGVLPEEYTQVDYIESSGTQYIDTGVSAEDTNYSFNIDFYGYSSQQKTYPRIFGYQYQGGIFLGNKFWYGDNTNTNVTDSLGIFNDKRHLIFANKDYAIVDNTTFLINTPSTSLTKFNFNKIAIFSSINGNTGLVRSDDFSKIKLYNFKIYYNNNLIRNFIPCYRNSNNEVGLYDIVNNTFYTNQGTGVFTYGSVIQIPNPDYPQDIKVVTGEQNITIQNKNLCDLSQGYRRGYINANGGAFKAENVSYVLNQYIEVVGGNTYTYSTNQPINNMSVYSYNENKEFIKRERIVYSKNVCTVTVDSNAKYILLGGNYNNYNAITQAILNGLDIQLENGSTATVYAPYQLQTYSLSLGNIELARINNYKDYIFKNEVGSPYYNADLELNEWYLHKEIGKATLTENSWGGVRNVTIGGTSRPIFYSRNDIFKSYNSMVSMMCNYFQVKKTYGTSPTANNQFYCNYERTNNLEFAKFDLTTAAEWKEWLSTHNVILVGRLANPTNTKMTDETLIQQLENINNNAKSYSSITFIECSSSTDDNETIQVLAIALKNIN